MVREDIFASKPGETTVIPKGKKLKEIHVPGGTTESFLVDKGPMEGLAGPKLREALQRMPNGGRRGAKPVSAGFRRAAQSAKAFGVPTKGVKVKDWKRMTHQERGKLRAAEVKRKKKARDSRSPEEKKAKERRRRSGKAAAAKVKRVGSGARKHVANTKKRSSN